MAGKATDKKTVSRADLSINLSKNELERVTEVFKMYETGLREATIYPKDLHTAMKQLGLNPTETEIQDLINEVEINGYIYFPAFCRIIMRKLREDNEENFRQELFRTLVGPKEYPKGVKAQPYDINKEVMTLQQFKWIMSNLPEDVSDTEADAMFRAIDLDGSGKISYEEFNTMASFPEAETYAAEAANMEEDEDAKLREQMMKGGATLTSAKNPFSMGKKDKVVKPEEV